MKCRSTPSDEPAYATLETDYGLFDLGGAGAPCSAIDLFKKGDSGKTAGLQHFLQKLEDKLQ